MDLTLNILMDTMDKYRPYNPFPAHELIGNSFMTDWYDFIKIKRTWRERLFTRPWMPSVKHKYEKGPMIPAMHVFITGNKIIGHPETIKKIFNEQNRRTEGKGGKMSNLAANSLEIKKRRSL